MPMLGTRNAVPNLAVSDLDRARAFYIDTLGLKEVDKEGDELIVLKSGDSAVSVYRSDYAGTNKATAVSWAVDDIDTEVSALRQKGVMFEHYDLPGLEVRGDVHVGDGMKIAWFKDPDGNILNIVEEEETA
jgi:catechol 2,3-dioxygenase-like lactoylglutathione lyase family enzyme